MYCVQALGHVAFYSLGNDGGDKLVEDVVHFFHVHLHHEAGLFAPSVSSPRLSLFGPAASKMQCQSMLATQMH